MLGNWFGGRKSLAGLAASITIGTCIPLFASSAAAELTWENLAINQSVIPGDTIAWTEFRFRNSSGHPITIRSVRPTCDCTTFNLTKMRYESGDVGMIKLRMDIGSERGTVDRAVEVLYDDTAPAVQILRWIVRIPEPVIIKPDTLCWNSNARDTRVIGIARTGSSAISVSKVESSNDSFVWRLVTVSANDVYEIHVAPRRGLKKADGVIRISAGVPGKEKCYEIRMYIQ